MKIRSLSFLLVVVALTAASCSSVPTFRNGEIPNTVVVTDRGSWLIVLPTGSVKPTGVIFYPGGFVKPEAYLLALAPLAEAGYPVIIVRMPLDLAFFDAEKGLAARSAVPGVSQWVVGGHSLGGVAAAIAVDKHREAFAGVYFWASYPASGNDLSTLSLAALSVSGSNDGLSTPAKVQAADGLLPSGTRRLVLEGANHGQFGDYGAQKGDGDATLSRLDQQAQVAEAMLDFLSRL